MKKSFLFLFFIPVMFATAQEKKKDTRTVTVYTTAATTKLR